MMTIKSLVLSCLLIGAVLAEDTKDLSKHNCCLHIKDASDAWWMTNSDVTKEVCESYYKVVAQFDSKTGTCDEHKNGTINDADWKSKCKVYGTSLGWTDDRVGAGYDATCYPIDAVSGVAMRIKKRQSMLLETGELVTLIAALFSGSRVNLNEAASLEYAIVKDRQVVYCESLWNGNV